MYYFVKIITQKFYIFNSLFIIFKLYIKVQTIIYNVITTNPATLTTFFLFLILIKITFFVILQLSSVYRRNFMTRFIDYIETSCKNLEKTDAVYRYKRQVLEEMKAKAKEISAAGLKDEKVIADLITNEFGNVGENFTEYEKKKKRKKLLKTVLPIGSLGFILLTLIAFFAVSAATDAWNKTWLIVVGGVFALVIFLMILAVRKLCRMRRVFHPIARMLIVACTILISVFAFLYLLIMTPTELPVWPAITTGRPSFSPFREMMPTVPAGASPA